MPDWAFWLCLYLAIGLSVYLLVIALASLPGAPPKPKEASEWLLLAVASLGWPVILGYAVWATVKEAIGA